MKESGAELLPARSHWEQDAQELDLTGFGAVLYEILTGMKPPVDASAGTFRAPGPNTGLAASRASAIRLAGKCLGYIPVTLSMQQAASEARLLWVMARQLEADGAVEPPPMPAPFLVSAAVAKPRPAARQPQPVAKHPLRTEESPEPEYEFDLLPGEEPVVHPAPSDFTRPEAPTVLGPKIAPGAPPCPKCDGAPVYVSRPRTAFERRLVSWRIPICRCHRCYHRYIVICGTRIHKSLPKHMERRFKPKRRS